MWVKTRGVKNVDLAISPEFDLRIYHLLNTQYLIYYFISMEFMYEMGIRLPTCLDAGKMN